ncbi:hypothetical protein GQ42DRAFT_158569, partial [Ramicandelaber brevisporus]
MLAFLHSILSPKCSATDWSLRNDSGEPGFCTRHIGLGVLLPALILLLSLYLAKCTARREDAAAAELAAELSSSSSSSSSFSSNALARGYIGSRLEVLLDVLKVPLVVFIAIAHYALYQHIARTSNNHRRSILLLSHAAQMVIWMTASAAAFVQVVRRVARSGVALGLQHAPLYLLSPLFVLPDVYHHFLKHGVPETLSLHDKIVLSILAGSMALFTLTIFTDRSSRLIKRDDGHDYSCEHSSSLFSAATFNWATPTIRLGNKKRLDPIDLPSMPPEDHAKNVYASFISECRSDRSLFVNLLWNLRSLFIYQFIAAVVCNMCRFMGPLCLSMVVLYFQEGMTGSKIAAYLWALGLFVGPMLASLTDQQQLWYGRRISFRLRGLLSHMIVEKTLKLPYQVPTENSDEDEDEGEDKGNADDDSNDAKKDSASEMSAEEEEAELRRKEATAGRVLNLLTTDLDNIAHTCAYAFDIYSLPMQVLMSFYLLYRLLGFSVFLGIAASLLLMLPSSYIVAYLFSFYDLFQLQSDKRSDKRVSAINELFQSIRIVKMFAWGDRFTTKIDALREEQIRTKQRMFFFEMMSNVIITMQPIVTILVTFLSHTAIFGHKLEPSAAFASISILRVVQEDMSGFPDFISWMVSGKTSLNRIEEFMKVAISITSEYFHLWATVNLGRSVHAALLRRLVNATSRFFDRTPIGRIIARFSSDVKALDQEIMGAMLGFISVIVNVILICGIIATTIPLFFVPGVLIFAAGYVIMVYYLSASREIKRIETTANAPLLSLYGELTQGVTTIRAYGITTRFVTEGDKYVDGFNRADYMTWAMNRWLCFLMDTLGAL